MKFTALLLIVISLAGATFHSSNAHTASFSSSQAESALVSAPSCETSSVQYGSGSTSQGFHACHLGHCPVTIASKNFSLVSPSLGELLILGYLAPNLPPNGDDFFKPPRLVS